MSDQQLPEGILFSQVQAVTATVEDAWFDPALNLDTPLFIDPFLLQWPQEPEFDGAFDDVFAHFRTLFERLARDPRADVQRFLLFPEVPELCLGYTQHGVRGAGGGMYAAERIRAAMANAIQLGLVAPRHFEEVGLLGPGIGKDRISDITARLILPRLAEFTARICRELGVPTRPYRLWSYTEDSGMPIQEPRQYQLPTNPFAGRGVLLVPKFLLRTLPTINRDGFEDFLWEVHADQLRRDFNVATKRDLAPLVLGLARGNLEWVREYVEHEERRGARPYPFVRDPQGFVFPYVTGYVWGRSLVVGVDPGTFGGDLYRFVGFLAESFKRQVEDRDGWRSLWDASLTKKLPEAAAQRLFHAMSRPIATFLGVDVSPEANAGSGPVDFKFSVGSAEVVLVELKLISNSAFWDGPASQLPAYLRAHEAERAWFVTVAHTDDELTSQRWLDLPQRISAAEQETGFRIGHQRIDGRRRRSASRRRKASARSAAAGVSAVGRGANP